MPALHINYNQPQEMVVCSKPNCCLWCYALNFCARLIMPYRKWEDTMLEMDNEKTVQSERLRSWTPYGSGRPRFSRIEALRRARTYCGSARLGRTMSTE